MGTHASNRFFIDHGFEYDRYSWNKGDFILMKTTLGIWYEVVYKSEIIEKITATEEKIKEKYFALTGEELKYNEQQ